MEAKIKAVVGLGNPGKKFEKTRHNIGFMILDRIADQQLVQWQENDCAWYTYIFKEDEKIILVKPKTYMNSSGKVMPFLKKKGISIENILIVHDELEKPFGKLQVRIGGSARGHNGLRSFIECSGSKDFTRLRFGIDRPENKSDVGDYVLSNFDIDIQILEDHIQQAVDLIEKTID